jgi:hypothetical protein
MEKQQNFFLTIPGVAVVTGLILLIPLVAMQFTNEVNWSVTDFILMGSLLFGTGTLLVVAMDLQLILPIAQAWWWPSEQLF